mmetsp:Transcript_11867/g.39079  ORF Transcript_11867/g.39079 Transcript_11867/m.39079 type:complete len:221 (-) Transcript_11867:325-987(-)
MHVMPERPRAVVAASTVDSSTKANFLSGETHELTTTSGTPSGMAPQARRASFRKIRSCSESKAGGRFPTYSRRSLRVAGFDGVCEALECSTHRNPSQNLPVFTVPSRSSRSRRALASAICRRTAGGGDHDSDRDRFRCCGAGGCCAGDDSRRRRGDKGRSCLKGGGSPRSYRRSATARSGPGTRSGPATRSPRDDEAKAYAASRPPPRVSRGYFSSRLWE